jgi:hypothetical protein
LRRGYPFGSPLGDHLDGQPIDAEERLIWRVPLGTGISYLYSLAHSAADKLSRSGHYSQL